MYEPDAMLTRLSYTANLVTPFNAAMVNPCSIDLTLAASFRRPLDLRDLMEQIPADHRPIGASLADAIVDPHANQMLEYGPEITEPEFLLHPGEFVLCATYERIRIPPGHVGFLAGKSTIARNGIQVEAAGVCESGFQGHGTLEVFNFTRRVIRLRERMRICQLMLAKMTTPPVKQYHQTGRYQNQMGATPPRAY